MTSRSRAIRPSANVTTRTGPSALDETWDQSPNLWWPADQAWCVVTDIDLMSSYVGGSRACIGEVLACPGLEAVAASPGDPTSHAADTINPLPPEAHP